MTIMANALGLQVLGRPHLGCRRSNAGPVELVQIDRYFRCKYLQRLSIESLSSPFEERLCDQALQTEIRSKTLESLWLFRLSIHIPVFPYPPYVRPSMK